MLVINAAPVVAMFVVKLLTAESKTAFTITGSSEIFIELSLITTELIPILIPSLKYPVFSK